MSIRVLVADDQAMVRAGFRMLLSREGDIEVVAEAENGAEAVEKAARFHPNVILMDIRMPELDGLEATRRILAADPDARVLVLTTFDLDDYIYEALQAGASGFVLKDDPPEQLLEAIRTVSAGDALLSPAVTKRVIREFTRLPRPEQLIAAIRIAAAGNALLSPAVTKRVIRRFAQIRTPAAPAGLDELTAREHEVFRLMADGLSNAEIGRELYISETTVKTHVTRVLQKLDLRDRVQAVVLAHQCGLAAPPDRGHGEPG